LICALITGSQRPELSVFVQGLLANEPHVVTVLTCAAALADGRLAADIKLELKTVKNTDKQNGFIHLSCDDRVVVSFLRFRGVRLGEGKTAAVRSTSRSLRANRRTRSGSESRMLVV
jgi:hypothetical protein